MGDDSVENKRIRLWLDDMRPMPADYDYHAKTAKEAIAILERGEVDHIGFDHDLGDDYDGTGYTVALQIEKEAYLLKRKPPTWSIQSSNPVGRKKIDITMQNAHKYWNNMNE